jgi:hypothetical protein
MGGHDHDPLGGFGGFDDPALPDRPGGHDLTDSAAPEEPLALDGDAGDHHQDTGTPGNDADFGHGGDTAADPDSDAHQDHPTDADHDDPTGQDHPADAGHDGGHPGDGGDPPAVDGHDPHSDHDPADDDPHGDDGPLAAADMRHVGADPDISPHADDPAWADPQFPPALELGEPPQPVDGFPWSDPTLLGHPQPGTDPTTAQAQLPAADVADLAAYAASDLHAGTDAWAGLLDSDDPATSSLARWWAPGG